MDQIVEKYEKSYKEYKQELDAELTKSAEGFVHIGYLLKVARDTNVLAESGYKSVVEFAKAEYNIDKTQVSRFVHINDKFSEGGYSRNLMEEYKGYGYAKLTLMLQLPSAINESLSPELSKSDIQAIKEEVDEEKKISDIEVMLEQTDQREDESEIESIIRELGQAEPELFKEIHETIEVGEKKAVIEAMAPSGEKIYSVRVKGVGRILMTVRDKEEEVHLVKIRTNEKTDSTWAEVTEAWKKIIDVDKSTPENWSSIYGMEFPKVAPVQQPKKEKRKEEKVVKAKLQKENGKKAKENCNMAAEQEENAEDAQIPGQMNVDDFPELQPDVDEKVDNSEEETQKTIESTESDTESSEKLENVDNIAEVIPSKMPENVEKIKREDTLEDVDIMAIENAHELVRAIAVKDYETANYIIDTLKKQIEMLINVEKTKHDTELEGNE